MWFWYALFSALTSAISVIINKKALYKINAALVSWALFAISIPILIYPALKDGIPKLNLLFWLATLASAIIFGYAKTLALKSLKNSLISEVVPLAFFNVIYQYILGIFLFKEVLKIIPLSGLALIIIGGYLLKIEESKEGFWKPFKVLFTNKAAFMYLAAMLLMALSTVFDKLALINMRPINQTFYLLLGNIIVTLIIWFYMFKKDKNWMSDLKNNFIVLSMGGITYTAVSLSYLFGITSGALALVSGVKKFEVIFILILGWIIFKDRPRKSIWLGSLIMLIGVILTKVG